MAGTASFPAVRFCIKNTFIDASLDSPAGAQCRSSSAPPACRDETSRSESCTEILPLSMLPSTDAMKIRSEKGQESADEVCSEASTQLTSHAFQSDSESAIWMDGCSSQGFQEQQVQANPLAVPPAIFQGVANNSASTPLRLSAKAKAFTPQQSSASWSFFDAEFQAVAHAACVAMQMTAIAMMVELSASEQGWSIVAWLSPQTLHAKENLLAVAKESLLQSAAGSGHTFVIGYMGQPFLNTQQGFSAVLGAMADHQGACWDFFKTGSCSRHRRCRWQHPVSQKAVEVVVKTWQD
mmetsp:Transcript_57948/g.137942  ORF Transcript_57948/g.137942 Transcript_57948/m.137942 type:complete len:295 (-) Transcript_57948:113-997(-)